MLLLSPDHDRFGSVSGSRIGDPIEPVREHNPDRFAGCVSGETTPKLVRGYIQKFVFLAFGRFAAVLPSDRVLPTAKGLQFTKQSPVVEPTLEKSLTAGPTSPSANTRKRDII